LVARTIEEATRLADRIGYPLALKVISPDVSHKSDVGGVRLDIRDKIELRGAATGIQQRLRSSPGNPRFDGFALQPMVRRGESAFELLVGVSRDPAFGPVITFGAGGIAVEVTADTATALPPLNSLLAHELISRTKVSKLLAGYRHLPAANHEAIADTLVSISALVCRFPAIAGLDINPLLADADGVLALDARILLDPANPQRDSRYSHLAIHPYPAEVEKVVALKRPPAPATAQAGADTPEPPRPKVLLRPIQPDDARIEVEFFDRLSPETRQWRFLHPIKSLTPEMIARFTQIDYDRDMALVALPVASDGTVDERIVAVARYLREVDDSRCEFAIVVDDEWQGRGLAKAILSHLIDHARTVGLRAMVGYVHAQNLHMLQFIRRMGFAIGNSPEEPGLRLATLALQPEDGPGTGNGA
jgi:acetyltransferase